MFPLPAHTVSLVLRYISPLTEPIPPHIISTQLRQRHHFLQISTASPLDYLCWPSPDNSRIIGILDNLPPLADHTTYPTCYTSDTDSTFAHAQVSSGAQALRLVFHWDQDTWKYHNLCLMPFPSHTFSTPQESLLFAASSVAMPGPTVDADSDNDDSYWASYGEAVDELNSSSPSQNVPDAVGEDAYWAQYASVQGSADSTVPSPLPAHRKLRPVVNSDDTQSVALPSLNEPIIDVPLDAIHSCPRRGLPSPNALAHLLSTVLPRQDIHSPITDDPHSSPGSTDPSPETTADSELATPPFMFGGYTDAAIVSPVAVNANGISPAKYEPLPLETGNQALTESIKGLYSLWRSGRKGEPHEKDRNVFLRIVAEAIPHD